MRVEDFGEVKHYGGISPAWPIRYEDLEPYYTKAEHLYQVHGLRGSDPTEPPASAPYLYPPVSHEPRLQQLSDDLSRVGLRPFYLPMGILLDEKNRLKSRCIRCNTCDGHPCLVNAKADAQVICVDPALEHPNVTLLTHAYVSRLETGPSGRAVSKVHVERNGATETYSADIVVVSLHSGVEYTDAPQPEQQQLAHAAVDAGALLVLGHHPHALQGWEYYGDGLIVYSLGNFVFDLDADDLANLGPRAFESIVLYVTLSAGRVIDVRAEPVIIDPIEDRPRPATQEEGASILERLQSLHDIAGPP
jgi:hypothetical protein